MASINAATARRAKAEVELGSRIEAYVQAKLLYAKSAATREYVIRKSDELTQGVQQLKDACYAEMDDNHGLGKEGLDCARELIEDAVWFSLHRMSAGGRADDAWLISDEKFKALAQAIGLGSEV